MLAGATACSERADRASDPTSQPSTVVAPSAAPTERPFNHSYEALIRREIEAQARGDWEFVWSLLAEGQRDLVARDLFVACAEELSRDDRADIEFVEVISIRPIEAVIDGIDDPRFLEVRFNVRRRSTGDLTIETYDLSSPGDGLWYGVIPQSDMPAFRQGRCPNREGLPQSRAVVLVQ
jgi:hypothetical protein